MRVNESTDVADCAERLVDLACFLERLALRLRRLLPFAASEVDKVEAGGFDLGETATGALGLNDHGKHCVAA